MGKNNKIANFSEPAEESKQDNQSLPSIHGHRKEQNFDPDLDPRESIKDKKPPRPDQQSTVRGEFMDKEQYKLSDVKVKPKAQSKFDEINDEQNSESDLMHHEYQQMVGEQAKEDIKRVFDYIKMDNNTESAKHPDDDDNVLLTDRKDTEEEK